MIDLIIGLIVMAIVGGAIGYIVKEKKRGVKCVGCPDAPMCASKHMCQGNCTGCGDRCNGEDYNNR